MPRRRGRVTRTPRSHKSWTSGEKSQKYNLSEKSRTVRSPANLRYQVAWQCAQKDKKASGPCFFSRADDDLANRSWLLPGSRISVQPWHSFLNRFAICASCPEGSLVQPSNLGLGNVPELPIPAPLRCARGGESTPRTVWSNN
jgi:hypothetical protein